LGYNLPTNQVRKVKKLTIIPAPPKKALPGTCIIKPREDKRFVFTEEEFDELLKSDVFRRDLQYLYAPPSKGGTKK